MESYFADLPTRPQVAVLGPAPTFSSGAASELCGNVDLNDSSLTIRDVVLSVDSGVALLGVVPLSNSHVGRINDTY